MIFPVGDDQVKGGNMPLFSYLFLGLNVLIFFLEISMPTEQLDGFVSEYGTIPVEIVQGQDYFTLFTNMFLHGGWMHLIGNMMFLFVFADNIEAVIGNLRFFIFYIAGGVVASLSHVAMNPASAIPSLGASGAISAVLGAYLVMFPQSKIKVLVIYFMRAFSITAIYFLGFWVLQNFLSGFASLGPESANTAGTAWWAHIGGFLFGAVVGLFFKNIYLRKLQLTADTAGGTVDPPVVVQNNHPVFVGKYPAYLR